MKEYDPSEFLPLSGIQHFAFCRRQWALIQLDGVWEENLRTAEGRILHENVHDPERAESRGKMFVSRGMPIHSRTLGLSGECDAVEFHKSASGVPVRGREGLWQPFPVEYKRGSPKPDDRDEVQLAAQAICLGEMLGCPIPRGALYYGETRHRQSVEFTPDLLERVRQYAEEMHRFAERGCLPSPKPSKSCNACSIKEICLPKLAKIGSAKAYNDENLGKGGDLA